VLYLERGAINAIRAYFAAMREGKEKKEGGEPIASSPELLGAQSFLLHLSAEIVQTERGEKEGKKAPSDASSTSSLGLPRRKEKGGKRGESVC